MKRPPFPIVTDLANARAALGLDHLQYELERVIFRRALEKRLEGYTLETAAELAEVARRALAEMDPSITIPSHIEVG